MKTKQISNLKVLNEAYNYEKPSGFSRGLRVEMGNFTMLYISGTASVNENGESIHIDDFENQVKRTYFNIKNLLESEGASWKHVVKVTIFIKDMNKYYDEFNRLRLDFFKSEGIDIYPASTAIQATMCRPELLVEMEVQAIINTWQLHETLQ